MRIGDIVRTPASFGNVPAIVVALRGNAVEVHTGTVLLTYEASDLTPLTGFAVTPVCGDTPARRHITSAVHAYIMLLTELRTLVESDPDATTLCLALWEDGSGYLGTHQLSDDANNPPLVALVMNLDSADGDANQQIKDLLAWANQHKET